MGHLETVPLDDHSHSAPFRLPVQWVNRPSPDFRGFSGIIASGTVHPGDRLRALPSGKESRVARLVTLDGDLEEAVADQSITIVLEDEIDVSRGDVLAGIDAPPASADQFEVTLIWMAEEPMLPGRALLGQGGDPTRLWASITNLKHKVNVNTLELSSLREDAAASNT